MKVLIQPEQVHMIGAAGFWLDRWPNAEKKRILRVVESVGRKHAKEFARHRARIEKIGQYIDSLAN